jgi:antitoxin (DNA-binding transcriptional repressor) of toxin-antitoxin stability system
MRVITPLDLRRSLGAILDAASAGERFLVERDHRPVAMLISVEDGRRLDDEPAVRRRRSLDALERLAAAGRSASPGAVPSAQSAESRPAAGGAPALASDAAAALRSDRERDDA